MHNREASRDLAQEKRLKRSVVSMAPFACAPRALAFAGVIRKAGPARRLDSMIMRASSAGLSARTQMSVCQRHVASRTSLQARASISGRYLLRNCKMRNVVIWAVDEEKDPCSMSLVKAAAADFGESASQLSEGPQ